MNNSQIHIVEELQTLLLSDNRLRERLVGQLAKNMVCNPDIQTNPVRSLEQLFAWLNRFLVVMPWEGLYKDPLFEDLTEHTLSAHLSVFRRIDQSTGYFYFIFQHLQDDRLNCWMQSFNRAWGENLNKESSWSEGYYNLLKEDPLFELSIGKYESKNNWHCWNDFFARNLRSDYVLPSDFFVADGVRYPWYSIEGNTLNIKTATIGNIADLLGESLYKKHFQDCRFTHIALDFYNYHHFHSPCDGKIVDIQFVQGCNSGGGSIIWDSQENRYRYEFSENLSFQMLETRLAIVIEQQTTDTTPSGAQPSLVTEKGMQQSLVTEKGMQQSSVAENRLLTALVAVGVAQVEAFRLNEETRIGAEVRKNQDLGCFLCGGSDVIIMEKSCNLSTK